MFIIDRYVGWLFLRVVAICFCSLAGLYVVIDFMSNFEEFNTLGRKLPQGMFGVVVEYYSPRVLRFFDYTAGLLAMVAGVFAVTWLQRTQELTALMAAGVTHARAVTPIIAGAIGLAALGVVNREVLLPQYRDALARSAQDWMGTSAQNCRQVTDAETHITISGKSLFLADQRIEEPQLRLPFELRNAWGRQVSAQNAYFKPATDEHPNGILLQGAKGLEELATLPSAVLHDKKVLLSPVDTPWLQAGEIFVVTNVPFEQLQMSSGSRPNTSTWEMILGLRNPSLDLGADLQVAMHARLLQPFLDITLILIGIPLILTQANRNVFVSAFLCLGIVAVFYVVTLICHWAGNNNLLFSPVLAAWMPLILFAPLAYTMVRMIWLPNTPIRSAETQTPSAALASE